MARKNVVPSGLAHRFCRGTAVPGFHMAPLRGRRRFSYFEPKVWPIEAPTRKTLSEWNSELFVDEVVMGFRPDEECLRQK